MKLTINSTFKISESVDTVYDVLYSVNLLKNIVIGWKSPILCKYLLSYISKYVKPIGPLLHGHYSFDIILLESIVFIN